MGERPNEIDPATHYAGNATEHDVIVVHHTASTHIPADDAETLLDDGGNTAEIRSEIEQTRSNMSDTIEAIQEILNPTHVREQVIEQVQEAKDMVKEQVREQVQEAKDMVREATIGKVETMVHNAGDTISEARYTLLDTIRENPIPAALAGLGLGWLFMNRRSATSRRATRGSDRYNDRYDYRGNERYYANERGYGASRVGQSSGYGQSGMLERGQYAVGDTVRQAQDTVGNLAGKAQDAAGTLVDKTQATAGNLVDKTQETAGNLVDTVQETAGQLTDQAHYQAQRLEDRFQGALRTNPLAVGVVALAIGTAVGLAVPETQREHQLMGEARDQLLDKAQTVASDTIDKVQHVTQQVTETAANTAKDEAQKQGLTAASK